MYIRWNNHIHEGLCCKEESTDLKKITEWSHIYYADYETDVTVSPHKGCFIGCCQLSGKTYYFIQRCVSGGRTITADNQKHVEGRIQDFDAVSLYPSADVI